MYCVKILYPRRPGSPFRFNLKHYFEVHIPLGLRLLRQHIDCSPARVECDVNCAPMDGSAQARYHLIASLYFANRDDAEGFKRLFAIPAAADQLKADWPNFTELAPEVSGAELMRFDPISGKPIEP